ncbi:MAG: hypothetical protein GOP50_12870 [Candidatus Heimdallarchaeota archaeon]|nr:hypothetical protein [Candidatus Heimdallarchaeota archaeon]
MKEKVELLSKPSIYPHNTDLNIQVIETNISWVFLTGSFAYKMKKEIKFGEILDFSTLEKRCTACENEIVFNRRLASSIYLESVSLTSDFKISGEGSPIECLVKMKQLDQSDLLLEQVNKGKDISNELLVDLAKTIFDFHQKNIISPKFSVFDNIFEKWDENFRTTKSYPKFPFNEDLEKRVYAYLKNHKDYFEKRGEEGKIVDGHGDLILANIFKSDKGVIIFDCIEFNEMLRIQDILEEITFLAMDLDFHEMAQKSNLFLSSYLKQTEENLTPDSPIIHFYKSYRAYVRAKVYFSQSIQEQSEQKKTEFVDLASKYMELSYTYRF